MPFVAHRPSLHRRIPLDICRPEQNLKIESEVSRVGPSKETTKSTTPFKSRKVEGAKVYDPKDFEDPEPYVPPSDRSQFYLGPKTQNVNFEEWKLQDATTPFTRVDKSQAKVYDPKDYPDEPKQVPQSDRPMFVVDNDVAEASKNKTPAYNFYVGSPEQNLKIETEVSRYDYSKKETTRPATEFKAPTRDGAKVWDSSSGSEEEKSAGFVVGSPEQNLKIETEASRYDYSDKETTRPATEFKAQMRDGAKVWDPVDDAVSEEEDKPATRQDLNIYQPGKIQEEAKRIPLADESVLKIETEVSRYDYSNKETSKPATEFKAQRIDGAEVWDPVEGGDDSFENEDTSIPKQDLKLYQPEQFPTEKKRMPLPDESTLKIETEVSRYDYSNKEITRPSTEFKSRKGDGLEKWNPDQDVTQGGKSGTPPQEREVYRPEEFESEKKRMPMINESTLKIETEASRQDYSGKEIARPITEFKPPTRRDAEVWDPAEKSKPQDDEPTSTLKVYRPEDYSEAPKQVPQSDQGMFVMESDATGRDGSEFYVGSPEQNIKVETDATRQDYSKRETSRLATPFKPRKVAGAEIYDPNKHNSDDKPNYGAQPPSQFVVGSVGSEDERQEENFTVGSSAQNIKIETEASRQDYSKRETSRPVTPFKSRRVQGAERYDPDNFRAEPEEVYGAEPPPQFVVGAVSQNIGIENDASKLTGKPQETSKLFKLSTKGGRRLQEYEIGEDYEDGPPQPQAESLEKASGSQSRIYTDASMQPKYTETSSPKASFQSRKKMLVEVYEVQPKEEPMPQAPYMPPTAETDDFKSISVEATPYDNDYVQPIKQNKYEADVFDDKNWQPEKYASTKFDPRSFSTYKPPASKGGYNRPTSKSGRNTNDFAPGGPLHRSNQQAMGGYGQAAGGGYRPKGKPKYEPDVFDDKNWQPDKYSGSPSNANAGGGQFQSNQAYGQGNDQGGYNQGRRENQPRQNRYEPDVFENDPRWQPDYGNPGNYNGQGPAGNSFGQSQNGFGYDPGMGGSYGPNQYGNDQSSQNSFGYGQQQDGPYGQNQYGNEQQGMYGDPGYAQSPEQGYNQNNGFGINFSGPQNGFGSQPQSPGYFGDSQQYSNFGQESFDRPNDFNDRRNSPQSFDGNVGRNDAFGRGGRASSGVSTPFPDNEFNDRGNDFPPGAAGSKGASSFPTGFNPFGTGASKGNEKSKGNPSSRFEKRSNPSEPVDAEKVDKLPTPFGSFGNPFSGKSSMGKAREEAQASSPFGGSRSPFSRGKSPKDDVKTPPNSSPFGNSGSRVGNDQGNKNTRPQSSNPFGSTGSTSSNDTAKPLGSTPFGNLGSPFGNPRRGEDTKQHSTNPFGNSAKPSSSKAPESKGDPSSKDNKPASSSSPFGNAPTSKSPFGGSSSSKPPSSTSSTGSPFGRMSSTPSTNPFSQDQGTKSSDSKPASNESTPKNPFGTSSSSATPSGIPFGTSTSSGNPFGPSTSSAPNPFAKKDENAATDSKSGNPFSKPSTPSSNPFASNSKSEDSNGGGNPPPFPSSSGSPFSSQNDGAPPSPSSSPATSSSFFPPPTADPLKSSMKDQVLDKDLSQAKDAEEEDTSSGTTSASDGWTMPELNVDMLKDDQNESEDDSKSDGDIDIGGVSFKNIKPKKKD